MQLNKEEGGICKIGVYASPLATWPIMMRRREWGCLGNDALEEEN